VVHVVNCLWAFALAPPAFGDTNAHIDDLLTDTHVDDLGFISTILFAKIISGLVDHVSVNLSLIGEGSASCSLHFPTTPITPGESVFPGGSGEFLFHFSVEFPSRESRPRGRTPASRVGDHIWQPDLVQGLARRTRGERRQ
jgi:hypothetical protein